MQGVRARADLGRGPDLWRRSFWAGNSGEGWGTWRPCWRCARLEGHGHAPVLALKDLLEPLPILKGVRYPVLQAPFWAGGEPSSGFLASSFADILAIRGYADADGLALLVGAWQGLIELSGAALVVGDSSPTLVLAATGMVPVVTVENWFHASPSDAAEFPRIAGGAPRSCPPGRLLGSIREVQRRRGRPAPETLPGLFAGVRPLRPHLPGTRRLSRRPRPARGRPALAASGARGAPALPSFFAYLAAEYPGADLLLARLAGAGVRGEAYLRNASPATIGACRGAGLTVHDAPPPLSEAIARASLVIHHGSLGTAEAALAAGRPQLALPRHLEQEITGRALEGLGVGASMPGRLGLGDVERAVGRLLEDRASSARAMALAREIAARVPGECLTQVTDCCLRLLG